MKNSAARPSRALTRGSLMTEPKWESDPRDQEPLVQRHPYQRDPTKLDEEHTADEQSTVRNSGLGSGKKEKWCDGAFT